MTALQDVIIYHADNCQSGTECDLTALATHELASLQQRAEAAEAECDELRRRLTEAQRAIDVLSNTVVAQDATIKRLSQQREDVEQYRAEIARITAELKQTRGALEIIKNTMAVGRNVGEDKEQAYQDAEEIADFALNNPLMHQAATA